MGYRLLLLAFPAGMRREFSGEMARLFSAQQHEARTNGDSIARLWLQAVGDALVHGTAERALTIRSGWRSGVSELRRWRWWMNALVQDVRYAPRLLSLVPARRAMRVDPVTALRN